MTIFVAPGPEVTSATPTRPLARAKPAAMNPAPCSLAGTISGIDGSVFLVVAKYGVVNRQDRAAAVAENRVDALVGQHLHQHVRARHAGARQRVCGLI